jgi:hypothetical protein
LQGNNKLPRAGRVIETVTVNPEEILEVIDRYGTNRRIGRRQGRGQPGRPRKRRDGERNGGSQPRAKSS